MNEHRERISKWLNRFWSITSAVSVRMKILGIALSLVFLLGAVAILAVRASMKKVVADELELRALSVAEDLTDRSTDAILVNNRYLLNQLISETKTNYPDIRYIFVIDAKGRILANTFGSGLPSGLLTANGVPPGNSSRVLVLETTEGPIWDAASPIMDGRVGTIRMGFSNDLQVRTVNAVTIQLLLATLLVSTIGILFAIFLTWVLTRPLLQLATVAHAVGQGDLDQQVSRWADDEIGVLSDSFNKMVKNLKLAAEADQENDRLRADLIQRIISAQEEERKRIACDLHDQTSQALVSLIVQLKLVETAPNSVARRKNLEALREQLRAALEDVRQMAHNLRPTVLDDLGLEQAIRWFADRCSQSNGLKVNVISQGDINHLPERLNITVYRVIQESLSNIVKHSQASNARVEIEHQPGILSFGIFDDGKGFSVYQVARNGHSLGIFGMQERVVLLDGQFDIQSEPGKGTAIHVEIPIPYLATCEPQNEIKLETTL